MPEQHMATTSRDLAHELLSIVRERPELDVCFASDGDLHQWKILEDLSEQLPSNYNGTTRFLLDFYHASEYLSDFAAKVHGEDNPERLVTSAKWRATLRELKDGADDVLKSMRYFRDQHKKGSKAYEGLDSIIKYLAKNNRAGNRRRSSSTSPTSTSKGGYPPWTGTFSRGFSHLASSRLVEQWEAILKGWHSGFERAEYTMDARVVELRRSELKEFGETSLRKPGNRRELRAWLYAAVGDQAGDDRSGRGIVVVALEDAAE